MNWKILKNLDFSGSKIEKKNIIDVLLENRGLKTKKERENFLNPKNPEDFTAKELGIDGKEVKKALTRIKQAVKNKEGIIIYGDYDADGICATAILWETLYEMTGKRKNILPYIPQRVSEGYGLNRQSIENCKLKIENLKLIITVDHGITADENIQCSKKLGIDVIVCDHHQINGRPPDCIAVVHTDNICATAITWYLSKRIQETLLRPANSGTTEVQAGNSKQPITNHQSLTTNCLDLVAIATIADLELLVGINRSFVKYGLEVLRKTSRCGLLAIIEEAGINKEEIGTYEIGYIIAPRLNAMGRMDNALESLRLLCTSCTDKAKDLASKLGNTNRERQLLTEGTVKHAKELFFSQYGQEIPKFIFISHESYQEGVIGLVAGKLVEEFYRPSIVISKGVTYSKASARSISSFNIIEAIRLHQDLLVDAGGHPMAAGFTIQTAKIEVLKKRLTEMAEKTIPQDILEKVLKIDLELPLSAVTEELYEEIQKMAPFGIGNPEPSFASKVMLKERRLVGKEGKHLRLVVGDGQNSFSAIGFNFGNRFEGLKSREELQIAYNIVLNQWNGNRKIELKIRDIK